MKKYSTKIYHGVCLVIAFCALFSSYSQAQIDAPASLQPGDLNPGDTFFVLFATSTARNTALNTNYNRIATSAQIDADGVTAAAGGTQTNGVAGWRTLYAFETSAGAGTLNTMDAGEAWGNVVDRPIYTTTEVRIADDRAALLNAAAVPLLAAPNADENGAVPGANVYTGFINTGALSADALGSDLASGARFGLAAATNASWCDSANANVSSSFSGGAIGLYVLSPLLRIPVVNPPVIASAAPTDW